MSASLSAATFFWNPYRTFFADIKDSWGVAPGMFGGPPMTLRRLWTSFGEVGILRWCMCMGHVELDGLPLAGRHQT